MTHSDSESPVRWISAADYVAKHRAKPIDGLGASVDGVVDAVAAAARPVLERMLRWLSAGDWRLLAGAIACLIAAVILAVVT